MALKLSFGVHRWVHPNPQFLPKKRKLTNWGRLISLSKEQTQNAIQLRSFHSPRIAKLYDGMSNPSSSKAGLPGLPDFYSF